MPDATPPRPLTAPDVVAGLLADVAGRDERLAEVAAELATCREHNAAIAVQLDQYRNERDDARAHRERLNRELATMAREHNSLIAELAACPSGQYRNERDDARKAFATLAGLFTQGKQSGWTARVSGTVLRRLCAAAGCEPPSGSDAPDEAALSVATQGAHAIGEVAYCGFTAAKGGERICWEALDPAERQRWQQSAAAVLARARAGLDGGQ